MKKRTLYALWAAAYILCAGLGFLPERARVVQSAMTLLSVLFFIPPMLLLHFAGQKRDQYTLCLIRNLSALSLGLTVLFLILSFVTVFSSPFIITLLHCVLTMVSAPMFCCGSWALSLFLWACVAIRSVQLLKKN